jgi:hypothetical protein
MTMDTETTKPNGQAAADQMSVEDAREVLQHLLREVSEGEFRELQGLSNAISALSDAAAEALDGTENSKIGPGFVYLAEKLACAVAALDAWHDRAWHVSAIISANDAGWHKNRAALDERRRRDLERTHEAAKAETSKFTAQRDRIARLAEAVTAS